MGVVTGHVFCSDTQRPARFAEVALLRKPQALSHAASTADHADEQPHDVIFVNTETALDGSFTLANVPVGDYYVAAKLTGYILPVAQPTETKGPVDPNKVLEAMPLIHVTADRTVQVDVTLRRGGVIAGRVLFDDATPVVDMTVSLEPVDGRDALSRINYTPLAQLAEGARSSVCNDEGRYRIAGLPPGKYLVSVLVNIRSSHLMGDSGGHVLEFMPGSIHDRSFRVYEPAAMHRTEAKVIEIRGDEAHTDADIQVNLSGLHSARGKVLDKEDRLALNQGYLSLVDSTDKQFNRGTSLLPDGSFEFDYLPEGTYSLSVQGAEYLSPESLLALEPKTLKSYTGTKMTVIVGEHDVTVEDILLTEAKPAAAN
jgi:hypothetical protein